jgi:hypothetical protein
MHEKTSQDNLYLRFFTMSPVAARQAARLAVPGTRQSAAGTVAMGRCRSAGSLQAVNGSANSDLMTTRPLAEWTFVGPFGPGYVGRADTQWNWMAVTWIRPL